MKKIALLFDRIRWEEKQIHTKALSRGLNVELVDIRLRPFPLPAKEEKPEAALQRCVSHSKGLRVTEYFEAMRVKVINSSETARLCGDKLSTGIILSKAGIPYPKTVVTFSTEAALDAAEGIGYPIIMKPLNGSWGRGVAVLSDAKSLRSYLELREGSSSPEDHIFFLQEFVNLPGRDIRSVCVGGEVVASIYRYCPPGEWRTNVALGGEVKPCNLLPDQREEVLKAAELVRGEVVGVDSFESPRGFLINEINSNVEFRGATAGSGVDVANKIVDYLMKVVSK
jgi:[lysine-biosynthesis-protein LysW]--L-2-aminoadipate ligase